MNDQQRADLAMVAVSLLWGVTFPLIRSALEQLDPHQFVGWRFSIALVTMLPLLLASPEARRGLRKALGPGILLGSLAWVSYFSQTIGLETVPAGRAAFVTGTNVVMVPLLAPLLRAGRPTRIDFLAAVVATAGLFLLTMGEDAGGVGLQVGDLWVLLCALAYAFYILALQRVLGFGQDSISLAFTQILAVAIVADGVLTARGGWAIPLTEPVLVGLGVCAVLATGGTFWLQTRFQGHTTPQRVALIFALEPVFATGFAWWLLGERIGLHGLFGAILVLGAVLGAELLGSRAVVSEPAPKAAGDP